MVLASTSMAGVRFLAWIKEGRGLKDPPVRPGWTRSLATAGFASATSATAGNGVTAADGPRGEVGRHTTRNPTR